MEILLSAILIFLQIIFRIIILDIILSWTSLLLKIGRPKILSDIIDPMYSFIKKIIPTTIGPFELAPVIVILIIILLQSLIITFFGGLEQYLYNFMN